jgi:hypothetical protein
MKQFGASSIEKLDFTKLVTQLLNLVKMTIERKNGSFSFEDKMIIHSALSIWAGSLVAKPELFEKTKNFSGLEDLIT